METESGNIHVTQTGHVDFLLLAQLSRQAQKVKNTPGGCLPLPRGYIHVYDHYCQTCSSLKPLGKSMPNFMWSLLGKEAVPIYGKTFKKFLLQNQKSSDVETWHAASGSQASNSLYK